MAKTLKQRLEQGLQGLGYVRTRQPRSGMECWQKPGSENYVFVGVNGGLRIGKSKSESFSIKDSGFYRDILKQVAAEEAKEGPVTDWSKLV